MPNGWLYDQEADHKENFRWRFSRRANLQGGVKKAELQNPLLTNRVPGAGV